MNIKSDAKQKLEHFKKETKFGIETNGEYYQGLGEPKLQPLFTHFLNESADEFLAVAKDHPTEIKFREKIKTGLERFNPYYLDIDTEDREKVCLYYQELMDCVGLESSDGLLNKWLYGFDPIEKKLSF